MSAGNHKLGLLLKGILEERSLSIRKLSERTDIDASAISRIINGKRKAKPEHLQRFAECLGVPISDLFEAAGYPIKDKGKETETDIHTSIESIQDVLHTSDLYGHPFRLDDVKQELAKYEQYSLTSEGRETIGNQFEEKLQRVGSIGPFIDQLKDMFRKFILNKSTFREQAILGSALLYFIITVDCIPDYLFPLGYIDDAVVVKLVLHSLEKG